MTDESPRALDVKRFNDTLEKAIKSSIDEMRLRQWAVEKAIEATKTTPIDVAGFETLCESLYSFVTKDALDGRLDPGV
jgi:hypothetical protein